MKRLLLTLALFVGWLVPARAANPYYVLGTITNTFLPYWNGVDGRLSVSPLSRFDANTVTVGTGGFLFGPGDTNLLYRDAQDLIWTNGHNAAIFLRIKHTQGTSAFGTTSGGDALVMANSGKIIYLGANNDGGGQVYVDTSGFHPVGSGKDLANVLFGWRDLHMARNIVWNGLTNSVFDKAGSGTPEGVVTADPGSIYRDFGGSIYRKATGAGNTGWVPMGSGASGTVSGTGNDEEIMRWDGITGAQGGVWKINDTGNFTKSAVLWLHETGGVLNTFVGPNAGNVTVSGSRNTGFGSSALVTLTSGGGNLAAGDFALSALTDGLRNTATGSQAGEALTTGDDNVAVGKSSLLAATIANGNVMVGSSAGAAITDGDSNVGVGFQAADATTTGDFNVAVGPNALGGNVTGSNNNAFGEKALFVSTQDNNNAFGEEVLVAMIVGTGNSAFGHFAAARVGSSTDGVYIGRIAGNNLGAGSFNNLIGVQSGGVSVGVTNAFNNNNAFGYQSLGNVTTGSDNTVAGHQAGDTLTTGSRNVILGGTADAGAAIDDSIAIGYGVATTVSGQVKLGPDLTWDSNGNFTQGDGTQASLTHTPNLSGSSDGVWTWGNGGASLAYSAVTGAETAFSVSTVWNDSADTFIGLLVNVTNTASGTSSRLQDWQVGGSSVAAIQKNGQIQHNGAAGTALRILNGAGSSIFFNGTALLKSQSDGVFTLLNDAGTGWGRLQLGGTTASFPSLKRDGTTIAFRLADDSAGAWFQWGGNPYLAANDTAVDTTMKSTGLSVSVVTGRKYTFKLVLYVANSTATDGVKIDFEGGTATATNFRAHSTLFDTALLTSSQTSALATDVTAATLTGDGMIEVHGSFEPSSTGTFIPRYAEVVDGGGTLTLYRGSHLVMFDSP